MLTSNRTRAALCRGEYIHRVKARKTQGTCTSLTSHPFSTLISTSISIPPSSIVDGNYLKQKRFLNSHNKRSPSIVFLAKIGRPISSTSCLQQVYKDDQEFQRKVANRLLDAKVGTLNQSSLLELKTSIISLCSKSNSSSDHHDKIQSFHEAKTLFDRLIEEYVHYRNNNGKKEGESGNHEIVNIELDTINALLDCWRLISNSKMTNIKAYSKRQDVQSAVKSEVESFGTIGGNILQQCCDLAQECDSLSSTPSLGSITHPDGKSFNIVLDGYAKLGNMNEVSRLFREMNHLAQEKKLSECRPDRISFNTVLFAYSNSKSDQLEYAQKANDMLDEMIELYDQTGNPDMKPDVMSFASVIGAYANAAPFSPDAAYQAEDIVQTMSDMYTSSLPENGGDGEWIDLKPNSYCYTLLLTALKNSGQQDAVDRAAEILSDIQASGYGETSAENLTALISAYANGGREDSLDQAEQLLDSMISMAESSGNDNLMPTSITFVELLDGFAQSAERKVGGDKGEAALRGERVVQKMEDLFKLGNQQLQPKTSVYNALINTWAKSMRPDAGEKAEEILLRMDDLHEKGFTEVKPNAITYTSVIMAYANVNKGKEGERILMQMYDRYSKGEVDCQPNVISFATAIDAYANQGLSKEAEHLFSLMNTLPGLEEIEPNPTCFNSILKSYTNSNNKESLNDALKFLEKLDTMGISDNVSYTIVFEKLSKVGNGWAERKGEVLLQRMWDLHYKGNVHVKPHANVYNSVINLMAKSKHPPTRAKSLDLFHELREKYNTTQDMDLMPNTVTYNATLSAFTKNARKQDIQTAEDLLKEMEELYEESASDVKPDVFTLTNIISCYANSNVDGAAERAEDILNHMQRLYEEGDYNMQPTKVAFGAVLNAWARVGNAERAEAILDHMESLQDGNEEMMANTVIYNTLINSWAKSRINQKESGHRAEKILRKMQSLQRNDAKPCRITFNSVLSAYNNSREADAYFHAKGILEEMENNPDINVHPDIVTYTTFLNIIAKWKNFVKKVGIAEQIVDSISARKLQMNTFTYDAILRVCVYTNTSDRKVPRKALVLAVKAFSEMQESNQFSPSSYSYSLFFNVLSKHSSGNEQEKLLSHSLEDCCNAGMLTESTLSHLKEQFPSSVINKILVPSGPVENVQFHHLPSAWSCNANKVDSSISRTAMRKTNRTVHNTGRQKNKG